MFNTFVPNAPFLDTLETSANLKDTHRENTPLNKTEALTKSINVYISTTGILNQLCIRDSYTQIWQFCMEMLRFHS